MPKDVQGHILLKFCENNKELADECLNLAVGALHDRKWAHDVMRGRKIKLRDIINRNVGYAHQHLDPIFINEKNVFLMAKEIQHFEQSYQKDFTDLSMHNLLGIQAIVDKCLCLKYYSEHQKIRCTIRKKITWQQFSKHFKKVLKRSELENILFLPILSLAIPLSSRLIELAFCTKVITEDLISFNKVAQSVNDYLMLSKDAAVRGYRVPLKSEQDYSDFDYLKMYNPYCLFIIHGTVIPMLLESRFSNVFKLQVLLGALISAFVTYFLEREDAISSASGVFAGAVSILSLLSILLIKTKTEKTVKLNQIGDLLKRTDIEIV